MHLLKKYYTENKLLLKEKLIYEKLVAERNNEINTLNNKIKYELTYYFESEYKIPISFNGFDRPLGHIKKIKYGSIDIEKAKEHKKN